MLLKVGVVSFITLQIFQTDFLSKFSAKNSGSDLE